jgi:hypothetical protein
MGEGMNNPKTEIRGLLEAPVSFWSLSPADKMRICNGGGPKGWGWLVPDTMWGYSMTDCFDVHDYDYYLQTKKEVADKRMYRNLKTKINAHGGRFRRPRLVRAWLYYQGVSKGGAMFY